jgi:hypothetical protein
MYTNRVLNNNNPTQFDWSSLIGTVGTVVTNYQAQQSQAQQAQIQQQLAQLTQQQLEAQRRLAEAQAALTQAQTDQLLAVNQYDAVPPRSEGSGSGAGSGSEKTNMWLIGGALLIGALLFMKRK